MREDLLYINHVDHPFQIQMAGISYCDETYVIHRPDSPITCMEYIIKGKGYVQCGNQKFTPEEGDVYFLPIHEDHYYYADKNDPWIKIWFNIYGDFTYSLFQQYGLNATYHFKNCPVEHLFQEFLAAIKKGGNAEMICDRCNHIYLSILQELKRQATGNIQKDSLAFRLRQRINDDNTFSLSLEDHCRALFCTKQHAIFVFKKEYGVTPHQYVLDRKLAVARNLLRNTSLSVTQIAEILHFCNSHYFSAFFKEKIGVSPLTYKKGNTNPIMQL